ncbi:uncharacterized protein HKW66_Vig0054950 [Vigna angularis]|uniref:Uncharacterized protein n=1 Tax=Phaseolus angularis TaxID=3914 RepID=A0A8T0KYV0_PHAAN|nr:uncharacterized protein HKW66_Vig0180970 [Vigna angularis]KAG2402955.1 uncharacterized protein HKW66_Vig0247750 [Vigna angularis]KAG2406239.1 uncharacterized protein HKW66_Vig0054950 [Vigna angularis]
MYHLHSLSQELDVAYHEGGEEFGVDVGLDEGVVDLGDAYTGVGIIAALYVFDEIPRVRVLAQAMVGLNLSWEGIVIVYLKGISDPYVTLAAYIELLCTLLSAGVQANAKVIKKCLLFMSVASALLRLPVLMWKGALVFVASFSGERH